MAFRRTVSALAEKKFCRNYIFGHGEGRPYLRGLHASQHRNVEVAKAQLAIEGFEHTSDEKTLGHKLPPEKMSFLPQHNSRHEKLFSRQGLRRRTIGAGKPIALHIHEEDARMKSWLRGVLKGYARLSLAMLPAEQRQFSSSPSRSLFASFPMLIGSM